MTMIDEQELREALGAAAEEFTISDEAIARILDEARVEEPEHRTRRVPSFVPESRRTRVLVSTAAVLVLASAIAVPLFRGETRAPIKSAASSTADRHTTGSGFSVSGTGAPAINSPSPVPTSEKTVNNNSPTVKNGSVATKIESNGTVNLTVGTGNVAKTIKNLTALVIKDRGFVESSQARVGSHHTQTFATGTIVLEVPQPTFPLLVAQVQQVGHATSVNTTSNNVTSQYVNLQSQIQALNVSLRQYFAIMTRATTISAILAVQDQINSIQNQIDQYKGQLKVLTSETTYSALTVNVAETAHHQATGPRTGFKKAWHESVSGFIAGFQWLLRLAGPLLFALVLLGALYALVRFRRRALLRRKLQ
ncbi:MAG: DUF4349 domain-containing protein [Acidimicrobiales bacterium]